jgi:hypothetical protein
MEGTSENLEKVKLDFKLVFGNKFVCNLLFPPKLLQEIKIDDLMSLAAILQSNDFLYFS